MFICEAEWQEEMTTVHRVEEVDHVDNGKQKANTTETTHAAEHLE